jgi:pimeloyl-ACP methyl ester carboxylesterase
MFHPRIMFRLRTACLLGLLVAVQAAAAQTAKTPEDIAAELQARQDARTPHLPAGCTERSIVIPTTDDLKLPGLLTLPPVPPMPPVPPGTPADKIPQPPRPPVAVLEQGSGVQDMDATLGPNKLFRQIAWGLCSRGVASIRFDRRAKVSSASFLAHADLDHEVVIDGASALAFAQTLPDVDPARVFLAGHSLGAQLGPDTVALRLTQKPRSVRGMVLMSGVARPIDVVLDEQIRTLGKNQGGTPEQVNTIAKMWADVFVQVRDPNVPDTQMVGVGGKLPASYFRDWLRRDPVATMAKLQLPALVTRGGKDVNSTHADFALLQAAATAPGSDAREFPGLGHAYMPLEGVANGSDIMTPGTVSTDFLDYIAGWMVRLK